METGVTLSCGACGECDDCLRVMVKDFQMNKRLNKAVKRQVKASKTDR